MRFSQWAARAPVDVAATPKVRAVVEPVLAALGARDDPHCWVVWGEDPTVRYSVWAPTPAGLATAHVRVNVPQEGPRASGKLVRWNRVQVGELAIETQAGHRIVTAQVEGQILHGVDADADRIAAFVEMLFAAIDGRTLPPQLSAG